MEEQCGRGYLLEYLGGGGGVGVGGGVGGGGGGGGWGGGVREDLLLRYFNYHSFPHPQAVLQCKIEYSPWKYKSYKCYGKYVF